MAKELVTTSMTVIRGEEEIEIVIDGYVEYYQDSNYGADADGNRGMKRIFVRDVYEIGTYDEKSQPFDLTPEELVKAAETITRLFLEN